MQGTSFDQTDILREDGLKTRKWRFRSVLKLNAMDPSSCGGQIGRSFATYKCVVFFGSLLAISSRLLPTDVHFTVTPASSNWQLQFPASEHKIGGPEPLPLPSLSDLVGGYFCCDVAEVNRLHKRMWTPKIIVWCYVERKWPFEWSSTHSICSQSSIQVRTNEQMTVNILTNFRIFNTLLLNTLSLKVTKCNR